VAIQTQVEWASRVRKICVVMLFPRILRHHAHIGQAAEINK
jgi:hypothetical protein